MQELPKHGTQLCLRRGLCSASVSAWQSAGIPSTNNRYLVCSTTHQHRGYVAKSTTTTSWIRRNSSWFGGGGSGGDGGDQGASGWSYGAIAGFAAAAGAAVATIAYTRVNTQQGTIISGTRGSRYLFSTMYCQK